MSVTCGQFTYGTEFSKTENFIFLSTHEVCGFLNRVAEQSIKPGQPKSAIECDSIVFHKLSDQGREIVKFQVNGTVTDFDTALFIGEPILEHRYFGCVGGSIFVEITV